MRGALCALFSIIAADAAAAPRRIALAPPATEVALRAYGLGLLPLDGRFAQFHGWLTYDPQDHATCSVDLTVAVASLAMTDKAVQDTIVGPDFLDAATFPTLAFTGACQPPGIGGMLTLHGVTGRFDLQLTWRRDGVVAEGRLRRADWGLTAMPFAAGSTVRIQVSVPLPPG